MSGKKKAPLTELGALIRVARQQQGISMDTLADQANVSRSTIHRLENSNDIRTQPQRLARILTVLRISPKQAEEILPDTDPGWKTNVLSWMGRLESGAVENYLKATARAIDLVAVRGDAVIMIEVRGSTEEEQHLTDLLRTSGYVVSRPV